MPEAGKVGERFFINPQHEVGGLWKWAILSSNMTLSIKHNITFFTNPQHEVGGFRKNVQHYGYLHI